MTYVVGTSLDFQSKLTVRGGNASKLNDIPNTERSCLLQTIMLIISKMSMSLSKLVHPEEFTTSLIKNPKLDGLEAVVVFSMEKHSDHHLNYDISSNAQKYNKFPKVYFLITIVAYVARVSSDIQIKIMIDSVQSDFLGLRTSTQRRGPNPTKIASRRDLKLRIFGAEKN